MEMLIQSSRGELINVGVQTTDTFNSIKERMRTEYRVEMEFANLCKGSEINPDDNILDYLKKNKQKLAVDTDNRLRSRLALNQFSIEGPSTTVIFGTILCEPIIAEPEEIYFDEVEPMIQEPPSNQDPMETTLDERSSEETEQIKQICRLCGIENHELIPIFGSTADYGDLAGKIRDSFLIIVKKTDVSNKICRSCMESLRDYNKFHENALKTNEKLGYSRYTRNYRQRREPLERLCYSCCARFPNKKELSSHYDGNEDGSKWQCNMCASRPTFRTKCSLTQHEVIHNDKIRECVSCGVRFSNVAAYLCHIKGNENDEKLHCSGCRLNFQTRCALRLHELRHKREWESECLSCGGRFCTRLDVELHMQGVEQDPKLPCSTCDASFRTNCALVTHKIINPETCLRQSIFFCRECGKSFNEKNDLTTHVNLHAIEKPFTCEICGKSSKKQFVMDMHRKVHDGERPYKCTVCNKGFVNSARLREHKIQAHTDEKRYKCSFCDKAFKRPNSRKMHMAIHTGTKALKCDMCDGSFNRGTDMRNHKILMHNL